MRPTLSVILVMSVTIMLIMIVAVRSACAITEVGQPAPALVAQELNGQQFDLGAERGKVVIVNFWASWCQPCREEMPALDAFYKRYHSDGLEMIGVSADSRHDRSDVEKAAHSLSYPVAMLNDAETNGFGDPDDLPTTWVIGRDGVVRAELAPDKIQVTEKSLDDTVLPLLGKSDAANTHKSPAAAP